jgi:quercetin dioxygenase-like cupin family protein
MRKKTETGASFCEIPKSKSIRKVKNESAFYKHRKDCSWQGVKNEPYKQQGGDWANIVRRVLIGSHGETAKFHVRYFEIGPGGNSSLEKHRHEHVVICLRGNGIVLTGRKKRLMEYLDTVYISPGTPHQLSNPHGRPFGFLCIVNARRDRPKPMERNIHN